MVCCLFGAKPLPKPWLRINYTQRKHISVQRDYRKKNWKKKSLLVIVCNLAAIVHMADELTHWTRVTHIWASKLTIIGSVIGLSPAIIWTSVGILLFGPLGTNLIEIAIEIHTFSLKKLHLKMEMSDILSRPQCVKPRLLYIWVPLSSVHISRYQVTMYFCSMYVYLPYLTEHTSMKFFTTFIISNQNKWQHFRNKHKLT